MSDKARLPLHHPACLIATFGGVGLSPKAPGTMGSLAALPFAWFILAYGGVIALLTAIVLVFAVGCWAAAVYERESGDKDPGSVVIDEVAGQWLALLAAPLEPAAFAIGFLLFRLFDIIKPWPVRVFDQRMGGGLGIMVDDIIAALFPLVVFLFWRGWQSGGF
jgi:phosphatidylglycerophosphatase A